MKLVRSKNFWWCNSGERLSRHHLFAKCRAWAPQAKKLWKEIGKACEWKHPRAPAVRLLFQDRRTIPAVLCFLRDTEVGRMITLARVDEESGGWLEEIAL